MALPGFTAGRRLPDSHRRARQSRLKTMPASRTHLWPPPTTPVSGGNLGARPPALRAARPAPEPTPSGGEPIWGGGPRSAAASPRSAAGIPSGRRPSAPTPPPCCTPRDADASQPEDPLMKKGGGPAVRPPPGELCSPASRGSYWGRWARGLGEARRQHVGEARVPSQR